MKTKTIIITLIAMLAVTALIFQSCKKDEETENKSPTCKITAPHNGQEFSKGENITISAEANDSDGNITEVRFFVDGVGKSSVTSFPYNYEWNTHNESIGNHTIKCTGIDNNEGSTSDEISVAIIAGGTAPIANFTADITSGEAPLTVNFTDQSTNNPTTWQWDFGDGGSSAEQNPSHTYSTDGTYTVSLIVTNAYGSDNKTNIGFIYVSSGGGGDLEWINVNGGTFQMGIDDGGSDEQPIHTVTLSSFEITKYEVTNGQYCEFLNDIGCNSNGSHNGEQYIDMGSGYCQINYSGGQFVPESGKTDFPVIYVSWYGANAFAKWAGGRLPTEAEWEFAARGGNSSNGYTYSGSNAVGDVAWYYTNSGDQTHQVGTKADNELGTHDMSGNVWEWCNDWYDSDYYTSSPQNNPQGPANGTNRVLRGGSWNYDAHYCRVAKRSGNLPDHAYYYLGFRVAR